MSPSGPRRRAIDLYSGIGGWTLGLELAGISTIASYEWWDQAVDTHDANFASAVFPGDIRGRARDSYPAHLDFVVGSPPCTQFSFSNRGGQGDVAEGLKDVAAFLRAVRDLKPTYWAMENVPRVAEILRTALKEGGPLSEFRELVQHIVVLDMAEFGLPQRRRRMIAGRFPLDLLLSYREGIAPTTLGDVIRSVAMDPPHDPVYNVDVDEGDVTDHDLEPPLDWEERRMNREAKEYHPVYNLMKFPDPLDQTARTITATCTRVSRESIVIEDQGDYRRLTVRERASVQGFPLGFGLMGKSYAAKQKLVGNALPPPMAYYIGQAMLGTAAVDLKTVAELGYRHVHRGRVPGTPPDQAGANYPSSRSFRAAIPGLRFHSGVRLELANGDGGAADRFAVRFYFGTSKAIQQRRPDEAFIGRLVLAVPASAGIVDSARQLFAGSRELTAGLSHHRLQERWTRRRHDGLHPYHVVDELGRIASALAAATPQDLDEQVRTFLGSELMGGNGKIDREAVRILAGLLTAALFNSKSVSVAPESRQVLLTP